jgi:hypothetical protein
MMSLMSAKGQETLNNQRKLGIGVIRHRNCLIVFYSLTKYSATFAEVKEYFGITAPGNQHGRKNSYSLRIFNQPGAAAIKIEQDALLRRWHFI